MPEKAAEHFANARLRIFWDDRPEPSVDAPVGLFFGAGSLAARSRAGIHRQIVSDDDSIRGRHGINSRHISRCRFTSRLASSWPTRPANRSIDDSQWEVRHEPYTDPPNWVGLFHATYRDFPHPERGKDLELLDTRKVEGGGDWCGHIVGTTYTFTKNGNLNTLEGDPRFYLDDSLTPQGQGTGSEEWGGGGDYWGGERMTLPFAGHPVGRPVGQMKLPIDKIHSAYRFLVERFDSVRPQCAVHARAWRRE